MRGGCRKVSGLFQDSSTQTRRLTQGPKFVAQSHWMSRISVPNTKRGRWWGHTVTLRKFPKLCLTYFISPARLPQLQPLQQLPDLIKPREQWEGEGVIKRRTETQRVGEGPREREGEREQYPLWRRWENETLTIKRGRPEISSNMSEKGRRGEGELLEMGGGDEQQLADRRDDPTSARSGLKAP